MGQVSKPRKAVLVAGVMAQSRELLETAVARMGKEYGSLLVTGEVYDFTHSEYYTEEMGTGLVKQFISFSGLIEKDQLPEIKVAANRMEKELSGQRQRKVNIDPGYLDLSKLVLATTKDYDHRLYLGQGIYGEVTLRFRKKADSYTPMEWTYADYREERALGFYKQVRERYKQMLDVMKQT